MHAANLDPTHFSSSHPSILSITVTAMENTVFDCAFVCVCMASLRTGLSSTKICENYFFYVFPFVPASFTPIRHNNKLAFLSSPIYRILWNNHNSLCTNDGPWMQKPKRSCVSSLWAVVPPRGQTCKHRAKRAPERTEAPRRFLECVSHSKIQLISLRSNLPERNFREN